MGLAFLAAAFIVAATTWFHMHNLAGRMLSDLFLGAFGSAAWTVPLLLGLLAWRFLRHPDRNAQTGRMVIGWTCLLLGGLGLVHIAAGTPQPSAGVGAMRSGGGLIGFFVSAPLVAGLTPWIAAPLLALVSGFGLLVITGTPVHRVPDRLAELRGFTQRAGEADLGRGRREPRARSRAPGEPAGCRAAAASGRKPSKPATTTGPTTRRSSGTARAGRRRVRAACGAGPRRPSPGTRRRPPRTRMGPCSTRWASGQRAPRPRTSPGTRPPGRRTTAPPGPTRAPTTSRAWPGASS